MPRIFGWGVATREVAGVRGTQAAGARCCPTQASRIRTLAVGAVHRVVWEESARAGAAAVDEELHGKTTMEVGGCDPFRSSSVGGLCCADSQSAQRLGTLR